MKFKLTIAFLLILCTFTGFTQQNGTLYNMRSIYQRTYVNPGLLPDAKIYIGIPVLGSQYFNLANNRLNLDVLNSVFEPQGNDSFFINVSKLSDVFGKRNYINTAYDMDILNLGMKFGNNLFGFNTTLKTQSMISYPGDLFKLLLEGNGGQNLDVPLDLSVGFDMQQYIEFGVWYGREHSEKLTFGGRLKYLQGISNIWLEKGDISFRTDPEDFALNLTSDIKLNTSFTWLDPANLEDDKDFLSGLTGFKNNGLGIDLGAQYYIRKKISVSASIIDLGFIKWNSYATTFESKNPGSTVQFNGVDFGKFYRDSVDYEETLMEMVDSLSDQLGLVTKQGSYTRTLFTRFYLGGNYHLTKNHNAGILVYGNFHNKKLYPGMTLSWNSKLTRFFSGSLTYTMVNNSFTNLGLGFSINGGGFQTYFVSDNVYNAFSLRDARLFNVRFGMGFTIGRDKDETK